MAEQVDAADLKSVGRFPVSVRVRPWSLSFVRVEESYPCGMALFYFIEYNYMAKNKKTLMRVFSGIAMIKI